MRAGRGRPDPTPILAALGAGMAAALAATACGEPPRQVPQPTLASIQREVFDRDCARSQCHLGPVQGGFLDLRPGHSYAGLVGVHSREMQEVLRVAPGDPDGSYLLRKLTGHGVVGEMMPLGRPPLPRETIAAIRRWIADGAPAGP